MAVINIDDVKAGMVLGGDVRARNNRILLRTGSTITEKHLQTFKAWGVTEADIEGVTREDIAAETARQVDPRIYRQAEQRTRTRFRHTDIRHPFLEELLRVCLIRTVRMLGGEPRE